MFPDLVKDYLDSWATHQTAKGCTPGASLPAHVNQFLVEPEHWAPTAEQAQERHLSHKDMSAESFKSQFKVKERSHSVNYSSDAFASVRPELSSGRSIAPSFSKQFCLHLFAEGCIQALGSCVFSAAV